MANVKWLPVIGFEKYYLVSDSGQIWSIRRNKLLQPKTDRYGYRVVCLSIGGKPRHRTIHRLVAEAFIDNPKHLTTVNHINEIKTDNRVSNLEWSSIFDNNNHGTRNQKISDIKSKRPVEQVFKDGQIIRYKGVKDAWRKTGINRCCIAKCCKGFRKTAGGYKWRYANENS